MRNHVKGTLSNALAEGWTSARAFAIMGGLYAAVGCFAQRLRKKHDAWNGALSGCATGLAIGWAQGPAAAAQNCAMLGALSYFLDGMGNDNESENNNENVGLREGGKRSLATK